MSLMDNIPSAKVYLSIVEQLRSMIETDGLVPGDKIPSERELSERLDVGRSSVREALRALELLGLIETRRGEGTFLKDFQEHRLVEILATFFLQNARVKVDLIETMQLIEVDCLRIVLNTATKEELENLLAWAKTDSFNCELFFDEIGKLNRNKLMDRIWRIVSSYTKAAFESLENGQKTHYIELIQAMIQRDENKTIQTYLYKIRKVSKSE
jgi:GntR family transcriptional regulator, transcriptional repressor for pyruvate dehydrogenase complex